MKRKTRASTEAVADAVVPMARTAESPTIRSYQAVVSAIAPAVFPTERFRADTKAMMLREFNRPKAEATADAGTRDGLADPGSHTFRVESPFESVTMADMESISPARADEAAEMLRLIVDRHEQRTHRL